MAIVYSSGPDGPQDRRQDPCRRCGAWPCACEPPASRPAPDQRILVRRERAGRGGRTVTAVLGLELVRADAAVLLRELKAACACGGTLRAAPAASGAPAFTIEIQGEHASTVAAHLRARGYRVAGGA